MKCAQFVKVYRGAQELYLLTYNLLNDERLENIEGFRIKEPKYTNRASLFKPFYRECRNKGIKM